MSESINLKVVIFWSIFVFIFAGLGIFGAMNQDLLEEKEPEVITPVIQNDNTKTCNASYERGNIEYTFLLDQAGNIDKLKINYKATNGNVDDYTAAANLSNINTPGIEATIQGEIANFTLITYIKYKELDFASISGNMGEFNTLNMIVENTTNLSNYVSLIQSKYTTYDCNGIQVTTTTTQPITQTVE